MAWTAEYHEERDLVFVSDLVTGVYTFEVRGLEDRTGHPGRGDPPGKGKPRAAGERL